MAGLHKLLFLAKMLFSYFEFCHTFISVCLCVCTFSLSVYVFVWGSTDQA